MSCRTSLQVLCICAVLVTGCKKRQQPPPGPPPPLPAPVISNEPVVEPPKVESQRPGLPQVEPPHEATPQSNIPPPPEPPKPQPRRAVRPAPAKPAPEAPPPQVESQPQPESPAPQLGELLGEGQKESYQRNLQASISEAREVLDAAAKRRLSPAQTDTVTRIRSFLKEADSLRETDLRTAVQLAQRAALLARDLRESLN